MSSTANPTDDVQEDPRAWLEAHVHAISQVVDRIASRKHLSVQDREELLSLVWTRLSVNDYRVLRRFRGRSGIMTYLSVVVERILLDWRIAAWGKWRTSAHARRLGGRAIAFERLVLRDGHSSDHAHTVLERTTGDTVSADVAASLMRRSRHVRRQFVELQDLFAADPERADPWQALMDQHYSERGACISRLMERALRGLPQADQLLLRLRHEQGLKVSQIAAVLGADQRMLYRRLRAIHAGLRRTLTRWGISDREAAEVVGGRVAHLPPVLTRLTEASR